MESFFSERRSRQTFAIYPTQRMRNGDLTESFFRRADGSVIPIMDLSSGAPFPNNQIPASRIASAVASPYAILANSEHRPERIQRH